ncbi:MAG: MFS transporter [Bacteroidia bacterium]|nr:MFS transporter [Bacteroidia bacterium]
MSLFRSYRLIERPVMAVIVAEFFLQLINTSFMSILPLYMKAEGYSDGEIGNSIKYRYLGVLVLALFVGVWIRRKRLIGLFYLACLFVPAFSFGILYTVGSHNLMLNHVFQVLWGASFTFMQVPVLPFILRNSSKENHTSAIALSYATWSVATIASHVIISALNGYDQILFSEQNLLTGFGVLGFVSLVFMVRAGRNEQVPVLNPEKRSTGKKDIPVLFKALLPTLIIAIGAGFTIPFISLFFTEVHGLSTSTFAALNLGGALLVAMGSLAVPGIKKKMGYKTAVPTTQSFAIIALIMMATTQFYADVTIAVFIAMGCFLLRQPLMNMAGPMTTEIVMGYVGKRNRELVSALTSAIWSGSWYFSGQLFASMRDSHIRYVYIFLITAALYIVGVIWYYLLILAYERKLKEKKERKLALRSGQK